MRRRRTTLTGLVLLALPVLGLALPTPVSATHPVPQAFTVELKTAAGAAGGTVRVSAAPGGTLLQVDVRGLTPGFHGFHVHETGVCDGSTTPAFTSAGGHYAGAGRAHGGHAGDLPPLLVAADGTARAEHVTDAFSIADLHPEEGVRSRAFVVHGAADNLANIPDRYRSGTFQTTEAGPDAATLATGDSGARVLCGVTNPSTPTVTPAPAAAGAPSARASLRAAQGGDIGTVQLRQLAGRVEIRGRLSGLTPGFHGMHIHATGVCDGSTSVPFSSAGGHHVGAGGTHGQHDGDLPALRVRADGTVDVDVDVDALTLDELFDADGAALIVHAAPDNLANIPARYRHGTFADTETGPDAATKATGDSGGRTACGVLTNTAGSYRPTGPTRALDTRTTGGPVGNGRTAEVRVAPAGEFDAAVLTVTAVAPAVTSRITVTGTGPLVVIAAPAGQVVATSVVAPLSASGTVAVGAAGGPTHVLVDVTGLYTRAAPPGPGRYTPLTPTRIVPGATLGAGARDRVQLTGRGGVPSTGVSAVQLTLTAAQPTVLTHLTAYPSGSAEPETSSVNVQPGRARAVTVAVAVGSDGAITVLNRAGRVRYLVDVVGWWSAVGTDGGRLVSLPAHTAPGVRLAAGRETDVVLAGVGGIPGRGAKAVLLTLTVARPTAASHLVVYAAGTPLPPTSNLNWTAGERLTTTALVPLGANGVVSFHNAAGVADLGIEVRGYVDAGPT